MRRVRPMPSRAFRHASGRAYRCAGKGKQIIGVGVMREMLDTVAVKSFEDGAKVILIPQAERMNAAAQNCLLKTLE